MNSNYGDGFNASPRCSLSYCGHVDDDEEIDGGDVGGDGDGGGAALRPEVRNAAMEYYYLRILTRTVHGADGDLKTRSTSCFSNRTRALNRIRGDGGGGDGGVGRAEIGDADARDHSHLDLSGEDLSLLHGFRNMRMPVCRLLLHCDLAFEFDLVGYLRRRRRVPDHGGGKRRQAAAATVRRVSVRADFVRYFGEGFEDNEDNRLREVLIGGISEISHLESLRLLQGDKGELFPCRFLMPLLLKPVRQGGRRREGCCPEKLHLECPFFTNREEIEGFSDCFAATTIDAAGRCNKWDNLVSLEIHNMAAGEKRSVAANHHVVWLDPIFRSVGVSGGTEGRDGGSDDGQPHLPRLRKFVLTQTHKWRQKFVYDLEDDESLVRLLNKASIKHLSLCGFVKPRHCRLMERHLSRHPNIETVHLSAVDLVLDRAQGLEGWVPSTEELDAIDEVLQCLLRLVCANRNVTQVGLGEGFPQFNYEQERLGSSWHDIGMWTALNSTGLKRFLVGGRQECVDFLSVLVVGGGRVTGVARAFADLDTIEALFSSIRLRPELCRR